MRLIDANELYQYAIDLWEETLSTTEAMIPYTYIKNAPTITADNYRSGMYLVDADELEENLVELWEDNLLDTQLGVLVSTLEETPEVNLKNPQKPTRPSNDKIPYQLVSMGAFLWDSYDDYYDFIDDDHQKLVRIASDLYSGEISGASDMAWSYKELYKDYGGKKFFNKVLKDMDKLYQEYTNDADIQELYEQYLDMMGAYL